MHAPARSPNWIRAGLRLSTAGLLAGLGTVSAAVLPVQVASAATFSVTNCNDSGTGSLRAEVAAAPAGHAITFASAVRSCSPILLTSGPIILTRNVTITGPGASALAISGGGLVQVFAVSSAVSDSAITGLTIENGNAGPGSNSANGDVSITASNGTADADSGSNGGNGGGIANSGTLTLKNDTVTASTSGSGGNGGSGTISISGASETVVSGDGGNGGDGGGIYNTGTLTLTGSTISGNTTGAGGNGGADTVTATAPADTLEMSSGNGGAGGGIDNTGTLTLTSSTISGNTTAAGGNAANDTVNAAGNDNIINFGSGNGGAGGGIDNTGTLTLTSSTISGSTTGGGGSPGSPEVIATGTGDTINIYPGTGGAGGGISNDGTAAITAATVSANSASAGGDISLGGSALTLTGTIVADSASGGNCAYAGGTVIDGGYNLDSGTTCALTAATDENSADPQLGPLQANGGPTQTMAPSAASPVIDAIPAGVNGCGTTIKTDQRGVHRPQGLGCDIGAYEAGDVSMQSLGAKPEPVPTGKTLTYTATVANAGAVGATGVSITDTLPAGLTFTSAKASQGNCVRTAATVTCTLGLMPAASSATVTIVAHVTAAKGSTLSDTATVSAATGDTNPGNDTRTLKVKVN